MQLDRITRPAFSAMLSRLLLGYQKYVPDDDLEPMTNVYLGVVERFPERIVDQAVGSLIENPTRYFPRAGDLAAKCREIEGEAIRRAGPVESSDIGDRCPQCRAAFVFAGYELGSGAVVGRRRCRCLAPGRGWDTPAARAWRDAGPYDPTTAKEQLRRVLRPGKPTKHMETVAAVVGERGDAWEPTDTEWQRMVDEKRERFREASRQGGE